MPGSMVHHHVVVVEHQRIPRDALVRSIDAEADLQCCGIDHLGTWPTDLHPSEVDVVVIAAHAPGTDLPTAVQAATERVGEARVVVVGSYVDEALATAVLTSGATAVLSTSCSLTELLDAVRGSAAFATPAHLSVDRDLLAMARAEAHGITERQQEVLRQLATGTPPQVIARALGIAVETCRDHVKALRRALDCATTPELLVAAAQVGLLPELTSPPNAAALSTSSSRPSR